MGKILATIVLISNTRLISLCVSRKESRQLAQHLPTFSHDSTLNAKDFKIWLSFLSKCKSICDSSVRNDLDGLTLKLCQKRISLNINNEELCGSSKNQLPLAEAHHVFTKPELSDTGNDPISEKLFQASVPPVQTTCSLQIY